MIIRGVVSPDCLHLLRVENYQREVLAGKTQNALAKVIKQEGSLPDIEIGVRGGNFEEKKGVYLIEDPAYIIDGLQRVSAARNIMESDEREVEPHIGVMVHFNTTLEWERERFRTLNMDRTRISPNIIARNFAHDYPAIALLLTMCKEKKDFPLQGHVCWNQRMKVGELLTASTVLVVLSRLHRHVGSADSRNLNYIVVGLQKAMDAIGPNVWKDNIQTFFQVVDECWGINNVVYKEHATHLRQVFLESLASVFSRHSVFWDGNKEQRLVVDRATRRKIAQFPLSDPTICQLSSSGGSGSKYLTQLMVEHINKGKRDKRLVERRRKK